MDKQSSRQLKEAVYETCGGSIRGCFEESSVMEEISSALSQLGQQATGKFLFDVQHSTADGDQRSRLLAFFPNPKADPYAQGIARAQIVPRSKYAIQLAQKQIGSSPKYLRTMYDLLLPVNAGAAGTVFEMLVHIFWRSFQSEFTLELRKEKNAKRCKKITIQVEDLQRDRPQAHIEAYDQKDPVPHELLGYFTPEGSKYPVLDSIFRYKENDALRILAIQISIAKKHEHGEPRKNALLGAEKKPRLALWDYAKGRRKCTWSPPDSKFCELLYVQRKEFNKWFSRSLTDFDERI